MTTIGMFDGPDHRKGMSSEDRLRAAQWAVSMREKLEAKRRRKWESRLYQRDRLLLDDCQGEHMVTSHLDERQQLGVIE